MRRFQHMAAVCAAWIGLFTAILMPGHVYSHCQPTMITTGTAQMGEPLGSVIEHRDFCSICKAQSHLSMVLAPMLVAVSCENSSILAVNDPLAIKSSSTTGLSPRSPPRT